MVLVLLLLTLLFRLCFSAAPVDIIVSVMVLVLLLLTLLFLLWF